MATQAGAKVTTDHEEIRRWAEERGAKPACVKGTGGGDDTGMIRLDFPGFSGAGSLQHISWDQWFQKFDESGLALLHQDTTASGQKSNFNKLIARETAQARQRGIKANRRTARRAVAAAGRGKAKAARARAGAASSSNRSASARRTPSTGTRKRTASASSRNKATASARDSRSQAQSAKTRNRAGTGRRKAA